MKTCQTHIFEVDLGGKVSKIESVARGSNPRNEEVSGQVSSQEW